MTRHPLFSAGLPMAIVATALLSACGGGDDGGCETVSSGPTKLTIRNDHATGIEAFMPQLSFGADMVAGECNVVGFDARGAINLRLEVTQCTNSSSDSSCDGRKFGPTRVLTVAMAQGEEKSVTINAATFAAAPPPPVATGNAR